MTALHRVKAYFGMVPADELDSYDGYGEYGAYADADRSDDVARLVATMSAARMPIESLVTKYELKWFEPYGGGKRKAPRILGSEANPAGDPAPGSYVHS